MAKLHRFPESLKVIRTELGLSQPDLAEEIKCHETLISHWERGSSDPSFLMLVKLKKVLDCSYDLLIDGEKEMK